MDDSFSFNTNVQKSNFLLSYTNFLLLSIYYSLYDPELQILKNPTNVQQCVKVLDLEL